MGNGGIARDYETTITMNLWTNTTCEEWRAALENYDAVLVTQAVNQLSELDAWYRRELPARLVARQPAHITKDEMVEVLRWKMKRGVWREGNRLRLIGNDSRLIKKTSEQAFAAVPDAKKPITILSELDGVGPATASAVLAAYRPDLYPFFDEWIGKQIPGLGKVAFTASYYWKYAAALRDKAKELTELCGETWSAQEVGQALWANSGGKKPIR